MRNARASIFVVGCLSTKRLVGPAKTIITPIATTTTIWDQMPTCPFAKFHTGDVSGSRM